MYTAFCDRHYCNQCLTSTQGDQWLFPYHQAKDSAKQLNVVILYLLAPNYNALMAVIRGQWGMFIINIIFLFAMCFCTDYYEQSWCYTLNNVFSLFFLAHRNTTTSTSWTTLTGQLYYSTRLHLFDANCNYYNTFHHVILNFSFTIIFGDERSNRIPSTTKSLYSPQHEIQLHTIAAVTYTIWNLTKTLSVLHQFNGIFLFVLKNRHNHQ